MQTPSILIVDDEPGHLQLMRLALRHLGCPLLTAPTATGATHILSTETPALILLDIAMPGVSGEDLLHGIRDNPRFDATKVIIVTAVPDRVAAQLVPLCDRVLQKPFDLLELEQVVVQALGAGV